MYELKDNFLSDDDFTSLKNLMIGGPFPWYYNIGNMVKMERISLLMHFMIDYKRSPYLSATNNV